jgi:uncharacterized lipoprotein YddW (UPF0748 family)
LRQKSNWRQNPTLTIRLIMKYLAAFSTVLIVLCGLSSPASAQEIRAFWADGFSEGFKSPEQVDTLLKRLRAANCNAIFAQVRKGGDAYYLSRYEPWAADNPQHFDALSYLIEKAHNGSPHIQVHAWINTCAVGKTHGNPFHIVAAHPEYKSLSDKGEDYDDEATKIDPGNPDAADWTFRVYLDVARHYDVDGIHFDFVRYGSTDGKGRWGYNPVSVARFNARYGRTGQPEWTDPLWKQWRRDQVTALVRKVYAMTAAVKPKVAVSAATITWGDGPHNGEGMTSLQFWNEKSAPMNRVFQDWRGWMEEGILDLNCQMSYYQESKHPDWFRHWIDWGKDNQFKRYAVPSSGVWLNPITDSFKQIDAIRAPSRKHNRSHGVLLYSYSGTNAGPDGKEQSYNEEFYTALSQPSAYAAKPPFAQPSEFPKLPWKENPKTGVVKGFVLTADALNAVDGAKVTLSGKVRRSQLADGTGFYAFVGLPPGEYKVKVEAKGYASTTEKTTLAGGRAADVNVFMGGAQTLFVDGLDGISKVPVGTPVRYKALRVVAGTDVFPNNLFVADGAEGKAHIRLARPPLLALQTGDVIAVSGTVAMVDGERVIDNSTATLVSIDPAQGKVPDAGRVGLSTGNALTEGISPNVRVRGRVTEVKTDRFVLDDGAQIEVMLSGRKDPGVEAVETLLPAPKAGDNVEVVGLATVSRQADGKAFIRLRPRVAEDIKILPVTLAERAARAVRWAAVPFLPSAGVVAGR